MKKANTLISLLVVALIALLGFGALYYFLTPQDVNVIEELTPTSTEEAIDEPDVDVTVTEDPEVTETPDVVEGTPIVGATPPADWPYVDMSFLPYEVYRPKGWYYRYFSPTTLGMDPAPIPEASEYVGMLSITKLGSGMSWTTDYVNELIAGYTSTSITIDGNSWTVLEGQTKANELFDSQYTKLGHVTVGSTEYVVRLVSGDSNYNGHESKFDILISILNFK